jgi:hypothetical protein
VTRTVALKPDPPSAPPTRDRRAVQLVMPAVWLVALVGYFAPWISRQPVSAALAWNAYDLYALLRLLPEIETGTLTVNLQTLQLPLLALAALLPMLAARWSLWGRAGAALFGCGLAAMTLPPYPQILGAWHTPGWRVPFWWGVGTMLFCMAAGWAAPRLGKYRRWAMVGLAELALLPALVTLIRLLPALSRLHAAQVTPGWGFWVCAAGLLGIGTMAAIRRQQERG